MNHSQTFTITQAIELAKQYYKTGQLAKAENIARQILHSQPQQPEVLHLLGVIAAQTQRHEEAIKFINSAIAIQPTSPALYNSLGQVFWQQKQLEAATQCYQQALALNPTFAEAYNNLGIIWGEQNQLESAINCFQQAIALNPQDAKTHYNLGLAFSKLGQLTSAIACYQTTLQLNPNYVEAYSSLGKVLKDRALIEEAIECYRQALRLKPTYVEAHNNLLYTLNFSLHFDRPAMFVEHQQFNRQQALPLAGQLRGPYLNAKNAKKDPLRRLKIGYISPDFRKHSLTYFVEPILAHHDHQQFEIFCYYNNSKIDAVTRRLQSYADHWQTVCTLSDEALAEQIRQDRIDILVDLMGHTANNRLLVFARKPAPIQVFNTIGYSNTTGLTAIDYRISDSWVDPVGLADQYSSEKIIRMPASYYCYRPNADSPPVNELPAQHNGYLTFGSFNSYAKLNHYTLALWARVLQAIPNSRLVILTRALQDPVLQQELQEHLQQWSIAPSRLTLGYAASTEETLKRYHEIDLALDTYPFTGATTTCQALWMGVPVITLVGKTPAARASLSILAAINLTELATYTQEEYLNCCVNLANQLPYLQHLRAQLRTRMQQSPLMDEVSFTQYLEAQYRKIWENFR